MIEEVEAIANLDAILRVPHIDVFCVGRFDLAQSMGLLHDVSNPRLLEVYDHAIGQIVAAGRVAGAAVAAPDLPKYLAMGVTFIKVPAWRGWITAGARAF